MENRCRKMKRLLIYLVLMFVSSSMYSNGSELNFNDFFIDKTLRIDLIHTGTWVEDILSIDKLKKEKCWAGSRKNLIDTTNYGKYQARIFDLATNRMIFSVGYCTLFGEWQTTDEAKIMRRSLHESILIPYPKKKVQLQVMKRNRKGNFENIYNLIIDPNDHNIIEEEKYSSFNVHDEWISGNYSDKVDIVIIGDGYTEEEGVKLVKDAKRFIKSIFKHSPWKEMKDRVNIRVIEAVSEDSGPSEPRKGIFNSTICGCTFNTFNSPRYLTTTRNEQLRDVASLVPYDFIYVMVNASRYGGGGIYKNFAIFTSDNEFDEYVCIHEFGHSFGGLADEYYMSGTSYNEFYPKGVEPWEPNITALLDLSNLKWKSVISVQVPIPTPYDEDKYSQSTIGAFEGAGYSEKGLFRPQMNCIMFSKSSVPFCNVCIEAIKNQILFYSE